jgi:hypothetical protein
MQIPMPHSGPRACPLTEKRQGSPAMKMAAATLVPADTRIGWRFTVMKKLSLIHWSQVRLKLETKLRASSIRKNCEFIFIIAHL